MGSKRKIIIISILLILAVGAVFLTFRLINKKKSTVVQSGQTQTIVNPAVEEANKRKAFDQTVDKTYALDKDFDGILDADEIKYKTSSTSADTDSDGLLDGDEITKYKTDPTKADTDGDGYDDGREVRYGYNPKGDGAL